jgi:hypothetical protein
VSAILILDYIQPWQRKSKEFGLSPIAVKAVKIESVNDATKIGTPEPKTVNNNIRISLNKNSSKKSMNSVQHTPSPMQAIADQVRENYLLFPNKKTDRSVFRSHNR